MKITSKTIESQAKHVNEFVLAKSQYKIRINRAYGFYNAYLHNNEGKCLRILFVGNGREMNAFLTAFQMQYLYMK